MIRTGPKAIDHKAAGMLLGCALVLVSIIAQLSVWPVYHLQRRAVRHEMKDRILAGLPESVLTRFVYTDDQYAELDLLDGGREIRSEGVMYDIVRIQRLHGKVIIEAARDDKETKLMADLDRMVEQRAAADKEGQQQRQRIIGTWAIYFGSPVTVCLQEPGSSFDVCFGEKERTLVHPFRAIDHGPPRSA